MQTRRRIEQGLGSVVLYNTRAEIRDDMAVPGPSDGVGVAADSLAILLTTGTDGNNYRLWCHCNPATHQGEREIRVGLLPPLFTGINNEITTAGGRVLSMKRNVLFRAC